jgi:cellulose synthase/poly-beta-1,6-N-acetylglucosamine synthase-like glycosyltransferase
VILILFFFSGFKKLKTHELKSDEDLPELTVIVCAKDEEEHIEKTIRSILAQDYPNNKYSIIVVNDRSTDSTAHILSNMEKEFDVLRVLHISECPKNISPKKNAITQAMKLCKTEYIVATDADTLHHKSWLRSYGSMANKNLGAATGICIYKKEKYFSKYEEIWQSMQTIENLSYNVVIAGAMANGFPITAYGGNMFYRKELFKGDALKQHIVSGDDSDIIYEAQKMDLEVKFNSHPASVVKLVPENTIKGVINQHVRWASKVLKATFPVVLMMIAIFTFYLSTFIFPFLGFVHINMLFYGLGLFIIKALCDIFYMTVTLRKFQIPFKFSHLLLMELVHAPFIIFVGLRGTFGKFTWKGTSYSATLKDEE